MSLDMGDVPTWIAAIASVGALVAAIIAGVAAWRVIKIELIRDEGRRLADERAQADLVAAWPGVINSDPTDPESNLAWGVAIRNASNVPVYQMHVVYEPTTPGSGQYSVVHELVPPGEWLSDASGDLYRRPDQPVLSSRTRNLPPRPYKISIHFIDAGERVWWRDWQGVLTRGRPRRLKGS